ncbi:MULTISPECIES: hypothetical protein [Micrococcaceae]|jgi:hypothetical protein|uniref:hypothetical protein n=1 Tax=Micrococcaceae TaxID=1268 RepID=UPI0006FAD710|nr:MULTISPECIES: hypothetical protein [Micrococcaceae]KQQ83375.1 hypothetical protein ASF64_07155 [Arthrobacter sp. Leaf137]MCT9624891.1 hypothetical protein [Pseudarthrobacter equi]MDQ1054390.1 hypothetical protein [Arthrobacter sp. SORGH_AS_0212]
MMDADWSFRTDDSNARYLVPSDEVRLPVEKAAKELREAMESCRRAAVDLGAVIRASSQAGYGTGWILEAAGLNSADLERVLRGEELF